ncbi:uncharacterized protein LDX57_012936 [Aspergillus melleus]|uniref:uncharacterized protein n=1 Tax=Aspergillus melleus TaxID=138277 RepID=UPI001E8EA528|nr:uncharacterized protein LDX57_012936 [Aspergillus melleus]KAH8435305.1 hypothetical protein LDX57_012936 [Aspergillus melleus]
MLKKFDLGGNPLGAAGVEILARVYIKSDLDFLEVDAEDMIGEAADEIEVLAKNITALKVKSDENESPKPSGQKKSPNKGKSAKQSGKSRRKDEAHSADAQLVEGASSSSATLPTEKVQAKLKHFACTRGLRSIPYLIVSDIPMTSGSAVHLASMLEVQRTPEQLLEFLPKGKTLTLPEEAQVCKGIIWQPCYNLADYACNLLRISERIHDLKDIPDPEEADDEADEDCDDTLGQSSSDQPVTRKMGTLEMRKMQSKKYVEFTRLNKRLRMEALKNEGVKSFEIWITALRMMLVSRALLLEDRDRTSDTPVEDDEEIDQPVELEDLEEPEPKPVQEIISDPSEDERVEQLRNLPHRPPMPMTSHGPFYPGTDEFFANFPALSPVPTIHVEEVVAEDENDESEASNEVESPSTKDALSSAASPPHRSGKANTRVLATREPEKSGWRYGLPLRLWRRIIADAVGANQVLDDEQQEQILRYASNWEAVRYEMTITGAEDHQQIWKFLETVHCFTYSRQ